jgi:single-strand DNA-binding protein
MSLSNISIVGNLVRAPEQVQFSTGNTKTNLQVAVNHPPQPGKEKGTADFYQVELWGKLGDLACKYLGKGNQVAVSGRFQLDRWQDRDGKERITPVIRATQLSLPPRLRVLENDESLHNELPEGNESESAPMVAEESAVYVFGDAEPNYVCEEEFAEDPFNNVDSDDEFPKQSRGAPRSTDRTVVAV